MPSCKCLVPAQSALMQRTIAPGATVPDLSQLWSKCLRVPSMNNPLPDISRTESAPNLSPLAWVGMNGIDLSVTVAEAGYRRELSAEADVHVDLPTPHVKGIHMSRLYCLLDTLGEGRAMSPGNLGDLLRAIIDSHYDCGTRNARLRLKLGWMARRAALVTADLYGWRSYPVRLDTSLIGGPEVYVRHFESLHPHDAVAWARTGGEDG